MIWNIKMNWLEFILKKIFKVIARADRKSEFILNLYLSIVIYNHIGSHNSSSFVESFSMFFFFYKITVTPCWGYQWKFPGSLPKIEEKKRWIFRRWLKFLEIPGGGHSKIDWKSRVVNLKVNWYPKHVRCTLFPWKGFEYIRVFLGAMTKRFVH